MKIAVAMSGGVDSSVTAALLKEEGHDVFGITMQVQPSSVEASNDTTHAKSVADHLNIPHYTVDLASAFSQHVIDYFCREYRRGRTPNPCARCNYYVKFGMLMDESRALGADYLATGHYAQVLRSDKRYILKKGIDCNKDQSYFLYQLSQSQLRHMLMPLGTYTKEAARQLAIESGIPFIPRKESQEVCFIPDNDYRRYLMDKMPEMAKLGPIVDSDGKVIGSHNGIINFTIGQRRGIGIAAAQPLYVLAIDPRTNCVTVGSKSEAYADELVAADVNWIAIEQPEKAFRAKARIRYLHHEEPALISPLRDNPVTVKFEQPQMAICPGQAIVFYDGDVVLGGGTIDYLTNNNIFKADHEPLTQLRN